MKPICLTVQAFGPYADKQVFDFRQLQDRCLFLITGPTGAGKTTVLDAICYALYGDTSGQERDASQMRSQHSDPSIATEVTFDFCLGTQCYRVWRKPQQSRPKKRGEGVITEAAQATLWKRTGIEDDADEGEPISTRATEVTEKVEHLLGFRSAQFRQVVLLPQGRFRELLLADSRQRQEILETLFSTEMYRWVEQALKEARNGLYQKLEDLKISRAKVLELAGVENESQLRDRLAAIATEIGNVSEELGRRRTTKAEADTVLQSGKETQARLTELDEANRAFTKLTGRKAEIDGKKAQCQSGKRAAGLRDVDALREQRAKEHKKALNALKMAIEAQATAQGNLDKASSELTRQQQRQAEVDTLRKEQDHLDGLIDRVKKLVEAQEELSRQQEIAKKLAKEHGQAKKELVKVEKDLEQKRGGLIAAEKLAALVDARRAALKQADKDSTNRTKLQEVEALSKRLASDHTKAAKAAESAQQTLDAAVEKLQKLEKALQMGYAGHLAKSLKPGEPCPVCGSKDHPAPIKAAGAVPDPDELDALREEIKDLDTTRKTSERKESSLAKELAVAQAEAQSLREQLGKKASASAVELQESLEASRAELIASEQAQTNAEQSKGEIEKQQSEQVGLAQQVEQLQAKVQDEDRVVQALSGTLKEREAEIPEDLRAPETLQAEIAKTKKTLKQLAGELASAQAAAKTAGEALAGYTAASDAVKRTADEAGQIVEAEAKNFTARLTQAGFETENQYRVAKLSDEQIALLEQLIEAYGRELAAAKDRVDRAADAARDVHRPNVPALETAVREAQAAIEEGLRKLTEFEGQKKQVNQWLESLINDSQQMASLDKEYQTVGYVADVANGTNPQNVTFQRFVLGALLDDVLRAASQRLKIMSKGRYLLQRQQDTLDRRRAGGLDLEVHDSYTGMSRPAGTLSGGESFLAALSLALGLADVVQSYAGGVYLDAIFIDEGFGSLDTEALDAAMQALIDLQKSGRLVGIISHVPELKERIDARLEVVAGKSGSMAHFELS